MELACWGNRLNPRSGWLEKQFAFWGSVQGSDHRRPINKTTTNYRTYTFPRISHSANKRWGWLARLEGDMQLSFWQPCYHPNYVYLTFAPDSIPLTALSSPQVYLPYLAPDTIPLTALWSPQECFLYLSHNFIRLPALRSPKLVCFLYLAPGFMRLTGLRSPQVCLSCTWFYAVNRRTLSSSKTTIYLLC